MVSWYLAWLPCQLALLSPLHWADDLNESSLVRCLIELTVKCRPDADGALVFSLPLAPDARVPFVNPFASVGPVGARLFSIAALMERWLQIRAEATVGDAPTTKPRAGSA